MKKVFVVIGFLVLLVILAKTGEGAMVIFDESLMSDTQLFNYFVETEKIAHTGKKSLTFSGGIIGSLIIGAEIQSEINNCMDEGGYLSFYVNSDAKNNQGNQMVVITTNLLRVGSLCNYLVDGNYIDGDSGTWQEVKVPFSNFVDIFGKPSKNIKSIIFRTGSGSNPGEIYFDDFKIVKDSAFLRKGKEISELVDGFDDSLNWELTNPEIPNVSFSTKEKQSGAGCAKLVFQSKDQNASRMILAVSGSDWKEKGYDRISFWVKKTPDVGGDELQFKIFSGDESTSAVAHIRFTTNWQQIEIPFSNFSGPERILVENISGLVIWADAKSKAGTSFFIDQMEVKGIEKIKEPEKRKK